MSAHVSYTMKQLFQSELEGLVVVVVGEVAVAVAATYKFYIEAGIRKGLLKRITSSSTP